MVIDSQCFVVKHIGWSHKKAIARPKPAKELAYPNARANRNDTAIMDELTRKINNETPTKAIRNLGNVLILKFLVVNIISGKLKISRFKIPNYA